MNTADSSSSDRLPQTPKKKGNRWLVLTSLLAFAALGIWLATSGGIDFASTKVALARYGLLTLSFAFAAVTIELILYSLRLWALTPRSTLVTPVQCARAYLYGQGLNAFVPARAGDAIKAVVLSRSGNGSVALVLAAGVLLSDKLVDTLSFVFLCLTAGTSMLTRLGWQLPGIGQTIMILVGLGFVVFLFRGLLRQQKARGGMRWLQQLGGGFAQLKDPRTAVIAFSFSTLGWLFELLALWILANAQGITLGFHECVWVLAVLNLGTAIPVSFANLGPFEASIVFALKQLGVDESVALAIAMVHHAIQMLTVLWWAGVLRLGELVRKS